MAGAYKAASNNIININFWWGGGGASSPAGPPQKLGGRLMASPVVPRWSLGNAPRTCLEVREIEAQAILPTEDLPASELVYEALWPHALFGKATIKRQVEALKVVKTYTRFF